ncbi:MAG: formylglycine-generating enzyme family protein [Candidatus Electrothrix scaldis]|nr:MAG: formylglycine-generating enzyme family protein [Candidatus Electrothrix sp. GW3-3]
MGSIGSQERLQIRRDDLQAHWDLQRQKLSALEREKILETRVEEEMRLEGKIKRIKDQLQSLEEELVLVERELQSAQSALTPDQAQADAGLDISPSPAMPSPAMPSPGMPGQTHIVNQGSIGVNIGQSSAPVHIHMPSVPGMEKASQPILPYEPEMIEIPEGPFLMGSQPEEGYPEHERPQHSVHLPAFFISTTPITNAQYEHFVRQSGHDAPKGWLLRKPPSEKHDHPVTQVNWHDAAAYCAWLYGQSGRAYRLPTEAEWEKAARFSDARLYPWGNEWQVHCCNYGAEDTSPVDAFPQGASAYGCLDMLGNVREWTSTIWGSSPTQADFFYPFQQDGRDATSFPGAGSVFRIHRGGSFRDTPIHLRCSARGFSPESSKVAWCGFRVVMVKE